MELYYRVRGLSYPARPKVTLYIPVHNPQISSLNPQALSSKRGCPRLLTWEVVSGSLQNDVPLPPSFNIGHFYGARIGFGDWE